MQLKCNLWNFWGQKWFLGWFKNLMYLGLLTLQKKKEWVWTIVVFVEFIIWARLNSDWADSFCWASSVLIWIRVGLAWAKWVKVFGLGCSYLKTPWAIKDGATRPNSHLLMNRVCQQLNYNQVGVCCFVGFVFLVSLG